MTLPAEGALAISWTFAALAILLSIGRFIIRYQVIHGLDLPDAFHGTAAIGLLTLTIASTVESSASGKRFSETSPNDYFRFKVGIGCLWLISLYCIKLGFLFFYRLIFKVSQTFMRAWWLVIALTFVTFGASLAGVIVEGGRTAQNVCDRGACLPMGISALTKRLGVMMCVLNVLSDLAVMALPLSILKGLQIPLKQKLGLAVIFSLALLSIAFDISRTVLNIFGAGASSPLIGRVLNLLELELAVIVSALISYRALLRKRGKGHAFTKRLRYPWRLSAGESTSPETADNRNHSGGSL